MLTGNTPSGVADDAGELPAPPNRKSLALWLAVMGISLLFLPLFLTAQTIREDNLGLAAMLSQAQTAGASVPTLPAGAEHLQATATHVQAQLDQLGPVYRQLVAAYIDWPDILKTVSDYDDTQVTLTGVAQTENRLVITGRASDDTAVVAFAKLLENSDRFSRVIVQSITSLATPARAVSVFATPTQSNASSTPQPIFLKQPLLQTFQTAQEEHTATFLAKADRFYEITTANLAPGVDTFLTVSLEFGPTYTNDDVGPGTLTSKVNFQAPPSNIQVVIRVTNLGQAGPEMSYQLLVQEVVPKADGRATSTPATSSTLVFMATATPTETVPPSTTPVPRLTVNPTASPTATASPFPTLAAADGTVEFAILVEVKPQAP